MFQYALLKSFMLMYGLLRGNDILPMIMQKYCPSAFVVEVEIRERDPGGERQVEQKLKSFLE